jgi:type I restriction enzyme M protein
MRLTERIEPTRGRVYDPGCGTGGGFVQSEKFIEAYQCQKIEIAIHGQERGHRTFGRSRMNLAICGMPAAIGWNYEDALLKDAFGEERFDFARAKPPFDLSDWSGGRLREDARRSQGPAEMGGAMP